MLFTKEQRKYFEDHPDIERACREKANEAAKGKKTLTGWLYTWGYALQEEKKKALQEAGLM